jgi:hypothetical protein
MCGAEEIAAELTKQLDADGSDEEADAKEVTKVRRPRGRAC